MTREAPGQLEFEQHDTHRGGRASGEADEIVDGDRRRPEQGDDARAVAVFRFIRSGGARLQVPAGKGRPAGP